MIKQWVRFLDLKSDADDPDEIHRSIKNGIVFKGTNLWILVFAIIIASVGLNTNSTAVIIGAMLISPLMGPINGMGYAIATYDFVLFRRALKNFGFALIAGLSASTIYFSISPLSTAHSELLARTSPTIYDVLIALFGGLAGIVAISSKNKGNVIPGVAIATALMPPLCTAGYGLATAQFAYFFGAFYLFTINTVFIGISSVLFSQILKLPIRTIVEPVQKRKVNQWITLVITITIIPSLYFGYLLVEKERFTEKANILINNTSILQGSYLLKHDINFPRRRIKLVYGGNIMTDANKSVILDRANDLELEAEIMFEQGFSLNDVSKETSKVDNNLRAEINRLNLELLKSKEHIDNVATKMLIGKQLLLELQALYPQISSLAYSPAIEFTSLDNDATTRQDSADVSLVAITLNPVPLKNPEKEKIEGWLKTRLNANDVRVSYEIIKK